MSINKAIILGRMACEPEVNYTPSGVACCKFSVATSESWTKDGEKKEKTEFHRIIAWRKLGELCGKYLRKGEQVYIEAKIETRSWEKDGQKHWTTELVADKVEFIGARKDKGEAEERPATKPLDQDYQAQIDPAFTADDIPF